MEIQPKLRALYLLKILYERTDEDHPLSTSELIRIMEEEYDLHVYRTTIASDIDNLEQFGIDIYTIKTVQNKFFINNRLFDIPELKLLVDAVKSSRFITEKKSKELVNKLIMLASKNKADELKRNLCIDGRLKSVNERIYYIVDALNDAINQGKKVSFQYYQYDAGKRHTLKNNGEIYIFSPYTLVWNGDNYYAVGYSDKHRSISCFRLDRIYRQPTILSDDAVPRSDNFSESEYVNTMFRMFSKKPEIVELVCDNEIMDSIIDKFGENVKTYVYDTSSFKVRIEIAATHVFYSWVFGFCGRVKIISPKNVKDEYEKMIKDAAANL